MYNIQKGGGAAAPAPKGRAKAKKPATKKPATKKKTPAKRKR